MEIEEEKLETYGAGTKHNEWTDYSTAVKMYEKDKSKSIEDYLELISMQRMMGVYE